ncbi:uncharacterized protein BX664DRAFT_323273 [Halteromyces radiatus]|uniref:uncharacterized protein n=1 Tax=Halteromyces radiatus TaxID=101107 RepID=UPI00221FD9D7|nr:uncharacterized protein BX664DRAFT_323273 [Halteromyces radiatus]KAI8096163.1 hypothetical protein BX664DRAFT_323273 [Halteromyces radiatus]
MKLHQLFIMRWYFTFLLLYLPFVQSTLFDKRQAVASQSCGDRDQTVAICSPSTTDVWYNNTYHELYWKYNNAVFNGFETLTFYLLQQTNSTNYKQIKSFDVVHAVGVQVVLIDDSWYPAPIPDNSPNVTRIVYAYLLGSGVDLQQELANPLSIYPRPTQFTLIQNAHNTTSNSTSPSSSPSSLSSTSASSNNQGSSLPPWAIAIIVIAAVAITIAAIALAWLIRNIRKNRKHQPLNKSDLDSSEGLNNLAPSNTTVPETTPVPKNIVNKNTNMNHIETRDLPSSIHSSAPMIRGSPTVPSPSSIERSPSITTNTTSATNNSPNVNMTAVHHMHADASNPHQTSSILSSTDALMIADTFRQFMRKPDWSDTPGTTDQENDDETDEQKRTRVANTLLQKQLAVDGTTVKDIERKS